MNKIGYIFSWILAMLGIVFLYITFIVYTSLRSFIPAYNETLLPGKIYILDYTIPSVMSVLCIIAGIVMGIYFYRKENHT
ncbi:hypothetical protein [Clostridium paridis]|uniref:Uncharacterized protein n=1 Tax=Clostridium paridis TaxID=2803863 RepID=A0A937K534_9CLOT|nr:hypothetical protein [Clostridium paridis]MBL4933282.1 hypothetical protein [Clostridium paridis]